MTASRRQFLSAGVAAGAVALFGSIPVQSNAEAGVGNHPQSGERTNGAVFHEGFENGADDYLNVNWEYVPNYDQAVLTTNQAARVGQHALRIHIDHDWDFPNVGGMPGVKPRPKNDSELRTQGICQWGEPFWYGFSLGVPADWQPDSIIEQVQEFHRDTSDGMDSAAGYGQGKPLTTRIDGSELRFRNGWSDGRMQSDPVTLQAGNWYDIVMHLNWTHSGMDQSGDGFARVWVNGEQVMDYTGPTAAADGDPPRPSEIRIYKWDWQRQSPDNRTQTYYFDEVRYANSGGSYEDVVPGER